MARSPSEPEGPTKLRSEKDRRQASPPSTQEPGAGELSGSARSRRGLARPGPVSHPDTCPRHPPTPAPRPDRPADRVGMEAGAHSEMLAGEVAHAESPARTAQHHRSRGLEGWGVWVSLWNGGWKPSDGPSTELQRGTPSAARSAALVG